MGTRNPGDDRRSDQAVGAGIVGLKLVVGSMKWHQGRQQGENQAALREGKNSQFQQVEHELQLYVCHGEWTKLCGLMS